ncbi:MAG TPA: redoxin domain-containing protein, partial [Actinomycetes bacterium]|nr:redoxin domain-containing protein [Actinomycetes bacterium]
LNAGRDRARRAATRLETPTAMAATWDVPDGVDVAQEAIDRVHRGLVERALWALPSSVPAATVVEGWARVGQPAPRVELPDLEAPSRQVRLADLRGHPAVVNFWAFLCGACAAAAWACPPRCCCTPTAPSALRPQPLRRLRRQGRDPGIRAGRRPAAAAPGRPGCGSSGS